MIGSTLLAKTPNPHSAAAPPGAPLPRDFVPWRFSDASLSRQGGAVGDEVVADDPETDPALHSSVAFVSAAIKPVAPFDHADAPLRSGPPFLPFAEPAL